MASGSASFLLPTLCVSLLFPGEGEIKISVTKEKEMYLQNIEDNCDINEELLQKVTKAYKSLIL